MAIALAGTSCVTSSPRTTSDKKTSSSHSPNKNQKQKVTLDPVLIRAGDDKDPISASELFKKAYEAYDSEDYDLAIRRYRYLLTHFEDTKYELSSLYNLGLSYERKKAWAKAAKTYRRIRKKNLESKEGLDATFRLAKVLKKQEEYKEIPDLMVRLLLRDDLAHYDRLEAYFRRGRAQLHLQRYEKAKKSFEKLLELNRRAMAKDRLEGSAPLIVRSYLGLGKTYEREVDAIVLKLPAERMGKDLEKKAKLFQLAQAHYFDALRQHHPKWSVIAGYRIGKLYEDFYVDIFEAEIPDDLNRKQVRLYFDELKKKIEPLLERALKVYSRNLELAKRISKQGQNKDWIRKTERSLRRVKALLHNEHIQRRAQMLILKGEPFEKLWDPYCFASGSVSRAVGRGREALSKLNRSDGDDVAMLETTR